MTYKTETFPSGVGISNSTPVFTFNPPTVVATGTPLSIPFAAYDADGDSLHYEFTNALDTSISTSVSYATGYSGASPLPSTPAASINVNTGVISANLNMQGQFVVAVVVEEYRNGLPLSKIQRDYQFNAAIGSTLSLSLSNRNDPACKNDSSGSIAVQVTNGTFPFDYSWSNGDSLSLTSNLAAGTYTVVCEDANGCEDSLSITLFEPDQLSLSASVSSASCDIANDGGITLNSAGGTAPYSFYIDSVLFSSPNVTGLSPGTYNVLVKDSADLCFTDTTVIIPYSGVWNNILLDTVLTPSCSHTADGQIQLINASGLTLNWLDNNSSSALRTNLSPGNYIVHISNSAGCNDSLTTLVPARDSLFWHQVSLTGTSCLDAANGSISFDATGGTAPYSYFVNSTASTALTSNLLAGSYALMIQDDAGCQIDSTVTLVADTNWNNVLLDTVLTPSCSYTADGQIQLINASGLTLNWLDNNSSNALRTNLSSGEYTVHISNSAGCNDSLNAQVPARDGLFWDVISLTGTSCLIADNGSISFDATGGTAPYSYFVNNVASNSLADSLLAGRYALTIQDDAGCQIDSTVTLAADTSWYNVLLDTIIPPSCFGLADGELLFDVNGNTPNINFQWLDITQPGLNRTGVSAGTYTLVIDDAGLCFDTLQFIVGQPDPVRIDSIRVNVTSCLTATDGEIEAFVSGGTAPYQYLLNSAAQSNPVTGLPVGNHLLQIIDSMGCSVDSMVPVGYDQNWSNIILQSEVPPLCFNDNTGEIIMTTNDGNAPNSFWQWVDDPSASLSRTGLGGGTYSLIITNSSGCRDSILAELAAPDTITFSPVISQETCFGDGLGSIALNPVGGTMPYSINWFGTNKTGSTITGTAAGYYYPTLIDYNGCIYSDSILVEGPDSMYFIIEKQDPTACSSYDGYINITSVGGFEPYTFFMDSTATNSSITGLGYGSYTISIQDSNNCSVTDSIAMNTTGQYSVYVPDAFTPGNDNINEEFMIVGDPSCFTDVEFIIYNRWGEEVFRTSQPFSEFWNGQQSGTNSDQSSYQYFFRSNELKKAGKIILFR